MWLSTGPFWPRMGLQVLHSEFCLPVKSYNLIHFKCMHFNRRDYRLKLYKYCILNEPLLKNDYKMVQIVTVWAETADRLQSGPVEIHQGKVTNSTTTNTETMFTFTPQHRLYWSAQCWSPPGLEMSSLGTVLMRDNTPRSTFNIDLRHLP